MGVRRIQLHGMKGQGGAIARKVGVGDSTQCLNVKANRAEAAAVMMPLAYHRVSRCVFILLVRG